MEFSLAKSLESTSEIFNVPFPYLRSDPAADQVNPGIGQIVSLYETVVPMHGHSRHSIEKKLDSQTSADDVIPVNIQTGSGESQMDSTILQSFQHPIVTDSVIFSKDETKPSLKRSKIMNPNDETKSPKQRKIEHKFKVI